MAEHDGHGRVPGRFERAGDPQRPAVQPRLHRQPVGEREQLEHGAVRRPCRAPPPARPRRGRPSRRASRPGEQPWMARPLPSACTSGDDMSTATSRSPTRSRGSAEPVRPRVQQRDAHRRAALGVGVDAVAQVEQLRAVRRQRAAEHRQGRYERRLQPPSRERSVVAGWRRSPAPAPGRRLAHVLRELPPVLALLRARPARRACAPGTAARPGASRSSAAARRPASRRRSPPARRSRARASCVQSENRHCAASSSMSANVCSTPSSASHRPTERMPGVSISTPPPGSGSSSRCVVVWRPRPSSRSSAGRPSAPRPAGR